VYTLADYRDMIGDPIRTQAYERALAAAIEPGASVVEIGTGVGYFAMVACRAGAARVVAIEPDPAIHLALEIARLNGLAERIRFVQDLSTRVTLAPADLIVSDLRGVLPLNGSHLQSIVDARRRLLKPGGALIPQRDVLRVAIAEAPAPEGAPSGAEATPERSGGIDLSPLERAVANSWWKVRLKADQLLSEGHTWHTIDYRTVERWDVEGTVELDAIRSGQARGLCLWFDAELHDGIGFSNAPGAPPAIYGQALFPLPEPIDLDRGDRVRLELRAKLVGLEHVWTWRGEVLTGAAAGRSFAQSTFYGTPIAPAELRKRADVYVPRLSRMGEAHAWILSCMSASMSLAAIAEGAAATFPDLFPGVRQALRQVADLSQQFSE
jgi:protein arginine N-methyltransferase 1